MPYAWSFLLCSLMVLDTAFSVVCPCRPGKFWLALLPSTKCAATLASSPLLDGGRLTFRHAHFIRVRNLIELRRISSPLIM